MNIQQIYDLVDTLNDECTSLTYHCALNLRPFDLRTDGREMAITFLRQTIWCNNDYPELASSSAIEEITNNLCNWLEAIKQLDLDRLVSWLPIPSPEES
jgi:hypothetical protein